VFKAFHTPFSLYVSYPISWILTTSVHLICYFIVRRHMPKIDMEVQPTRYIQAD